MRLDDVRFGSKADIDDHSGDVRFTPKSSHRRHSPNVCFVPIADITGLLYSITSSARSSIDGGTSRPSALAVLRLSTISNLAGA